MIVLQQYNGILCSIIFTRTLRKNILIDWKDVQDGCGLVDESVQ